MEKIVDEIKETFLKEKQGIYEAMSKDYNEDDMKIEYNKFLNVFEKIEQQGVKLNKNKTITIIYNGNPYISLEICIRGILNNCNIILISDSMMENVNREIINIMLHYIQIKNFNLVIKRYTDIEIEKVAVSNKITDKILFLGDKRIFRKLKAKTNIPIIYNGFGSIIIYTDDEDEFEEQIYDVKNYAIDNNIIVNMFNEDIDEDIKSINKDGDNDICIIFSNDIEKIKKFQENVNANHILINSIDIQNINLQLKNEIWE